MDGPFANRASTTVVNNIEEDIIVLYATIASLETNLMAYFILTG